MGAESAIVAVATWTAVVLASGLTVGAVAAVWRVRPRVARVVCGLGLATALAGGGVALAGSGDSGASQPAPVSVDWPGPTPGRHHARVTVRSGDCLWAIAARRLAHPSPAHIATSWPRWWHANRGVIGADPDLVRPGQRLRPPAPIWSSS